jgi:hypothetical protein
MRINLAEHVAGPGEITNVAEFYTNYLMGSVKDTTGVDCDDNN